MTKIRILPEQLANQIAAGEVVERPASVVKELVENSLDAQAGRIEIDIEGGGTRLIRVIDNGIGMAEDDLLLSLERHGTSKIRTREDLEAITTLGFRGEAIPSIGSVAELTISSRTADAPLGTRVDLHYGKLLKVHEAGCGLGTTVEVRRLFGNTPARRKFLRTARTELSHIEEVVRNYALAATTTAFVLRVDGRESLSLEENLGEEARLAAILRYPGNFIAVGRAGGDRSRPRLHGYLLPPEDERCASAGLRLYVNGRAVRDRMLAHGVAEGMRSFLLRGKGPAGLIHLSLPPGEVDVNVHPAKHEVRFRNARDIHSLVSGTVAQAMVTHQERVRSQIFGPQRIEPRSAVPLDPPSLTTTEPQGRQWYRPEKTVAHARPLPFSSPVAPPPQQPHPPDQHELAPLPGARRHRLLVIGQYDNLYIFCKSSSGLLVIDQHAAHERLLYEKLRRQYLSGSIARQTLMFPVTIELNTFQAQLVEKNSAELERIGFSCREFGGTTYIISAVPAVAGQIAPQELFYDLLQRFGSQEDRGGGSDRLDTILADIACKAAVKAGTALSEPEIDKLLDEMAAADLFSHCPHGRPVVRIFSPEEVKKWFHRG
ncbi:MAG: DNA mismatch repair endonuclease MutL [Desulforhopalus sp.]|jgi:DNA mismatch repair protein MutL|nr:DNA mismatch repair endonuclease MutL [Desulforhopalus sp.]